MMNQLVQHPSREGFSMPIPICAGARNLQDRVEPPIKKIGFVFDKFKIGSPAQQLLDRFLIGFQRNGIFEPAPDDRIIVGGTSEFRAFDAIGPRSGSKALSSDKSLLHNNGIIVVGSEAALLMVVRHASIGTPIFAYGAGAGNESSEIARAKNLPILSGTVALTLLQLPKFEIPKRARITEALIVVQGKYPDAELEGLDGLYPFIGGDIVQSRKLVDDQVWDAGDRKEWSWDLLRAALSRTDKPQGHALEDGRTENMVDLGLVPKMATAPRAWQLKHRNGALATILVLDGVVGDTLVALKTTGVFGRTKIHSTQLFRSPAPQEEHYSRLAAAILQFFETSIPPWPLARTHEVRRVIDFMADPAAQTPNWQTIPSP